MALEYVPQMFSTWPSKSKNNLAAELALLCSCGKLERDVGAVKLGLIWAGTIASKPCPVHKGQLHSPLCVESKDNSADPAAGAAVNSIRCSRLSMRSNRLLRFALLARESMACIESGCQRRFFFMLQIWDVK